MILVDVYSDVICPWCFIGKRRLEKGIARTGRPATVRWHPFQLNPDMPHEGVARRAYRVKKFGSWERSQELDAQVAEAGRGEGVAFHFDRMTRTPNTFDAHRVVWLAGERGVQGAVVEALFVAYFTDGRDLSDRATLVAVAAGAGLGAGEVGALLAGDEGREPVRDAEQRGYRLGTSGVPFIVINHAVALSGAQAPETFRAAIEQAMAAGPVDACGLDPAAGDRTC